MKQSPRETSKQWRERLLRETEGLTRPGEIIMYLMLDELKNGPPPPENDDERR